MAINVSAAKRGFLYNPASKSLGIYVDGVKVADYASTVGRTYYVNKVTGSSGADGLSWGSAMDEISTAVTASETYRALGGDPGGRATTLNDYVRNTIIVQALGEHTTDMYYTVLTALPLHCNLIGLGDWPAGYGQGIAAIGDQDAAHNGITTTATVRGLNMMNLQVNCDGGSSYDSMNVANFFRSRIEDCWLGQMHGATASNCNSGLLCDNSMSSVLIRHCLIGQTNTATRPTYGMDLNTCTPGSNNLIEDNVIFGGTTGILCNAADNWNGAVIRNNTIGAITGQCSGPPIVAPLYAYIVDNRCFGASTITVTSANQVAGNIVNVAGTTVSMDREDT